MTKSIIRADSKQRVSIGKWTELAPGSYYRITKGENGELTLTPAIELEADAEVTS